MTARRRLTKRRARADLSVDAFLVVGCLEHRAQPLTDGFDRTEFPWEGAAGFDDERVVVVGADEIVFG